MIRYIPTNCVYVDYDEIISAYRTPSNSLRLKVLKNYSPTI